MAAAFERSECEENRGDSTEFTLASSLASRVGCGGEPGWYTGEPSPTVSELGFRATGCRD